MFNNKINQKKYLGLILIFKTIFKSYCKSSHFLDYFQALTVDQEVVIVIYGSQSLIRSFCLPLKIYVNPMQPESSLIHSVTEGASKTEQ